MSFGPIGRGREVTDAASVDAGLVPADQVLPQVDEPAVQRHVARLQVQGIYGGQHRHAEPEVLKSQVIGFDEERSRFCGVLGCRFLLPRIHIEGHFSIAQQCLVEQQMHVAQIHAAAVVDGKETGPDAQNHRGVGRNHPVISFLQIEPVKLQVKFEQRHQPDVGYGIAHAGHRVTLSGQYTDILQMDFHRKGEPEFPDLYLHAGGLGHLLFGDADRQILNGRNVKQHREKEDSDNYPHQRLERDPEPARPDHMTLDGRRFRLLLRVFLYIGFFFHPVRKNINSRGVVSGSVRRRSMPSPR